MCHLSAENIYNNKPLTGISTCEWLVIGVGVLSLQHILIAVLKALLVTSAIRPLCMASPTAYT